MVNPKIVDAADVQRRPRKSPATRLIESVPDDLRTARELATHFEVSIETIRRLGRQRLSDGTPKFKGPSKAAKTGDLHVWLYTEEDVAELADYFGQKGPKKVATKRVRSRKKT